MAHQAAHNGLSIACLPIIRTHNSTGYTALVRVLDQYKITPSREIFIVYPSRKHLSAKIRLLIDFLKNSFEIN
jgi:DNA-binding transcriptional LysR family regulator